MQHPPRQYATGSTLGSPIIPVEGLKSPSSKALAFTRKFGRAYHSSEDLIQETLTIFQKIRKYTKQQPAQKHAISSCSSSSDSSDDEHTSFSIWDESTLSAQGIFSVSETSVFELFRLRSHALSRTVPPTEAKILNDFLNIQHTSSNLILQNKRKRPQPPLTRTNPTARNTTTTTTTTSQSMQYPDISEFGKRFCEFYNETISTESKKYRMGKLARYRSLAFATSTLTNKPGKNQINRIKRRFLEQFETSSPTTAATDELPEGNDNELEKSGYSSDDDSYRQKVRVKPSSEIYPIERMNTSQSQCINNDERQLYQTNSIQDANIESLEMKIVPQKASRKLIVDMKQMQLNRGSSFGFQVPSFTSFEESKSIQTPIRSTMSKQSGDPQQTQSSFQDLSMVKSGQITPRIMKRSREPAEILSPTTDSIIIAQQKKEFLSNIPFFTDPSEEISTTTTTTTSADQNLIQNTSYFQKQKQYKFNSPPDSTTNTQSARTLIPSNKLGQLNKSNTLILNSNNNSTLQSNINKHSPQLGETSTGFLPRIVKPYLPQQSSLYTPKRPTLTKHANFNNSNNNNNSNAFSFQGASPSAPFFDLRRSTVMKQSTTTSSQTLTVADLLGSKSLTDRLD